MNYDVKLDKIISRKKLLNVLKSHSPIRFGRKKIRNLNIYGVTITSNDNRLICNTEFDNVRFEKVIFDNVTIENCNFVGNYFQDTEFKQCQIIESGFIDYTGFHKVKFNSSNLNNVDFSCSQFTCSIFKECKLDYLNFNKSYISTKSLEQTPAFFTNCKFRCTNFRYIPNTAIRFDHTILSLSGRLVSDPIALKNMGFYGVDIISIHPDQMIHSVGPIGSRNDYTFYIPSIDFVRCGCFDGSLQEFQDKVWKTHPDGKYHDQYMAAIQLFKVYRDQFKKV